MASATIDAVGYVGAMMVMLVVAADVKVGVVIRLMSPVALVALLLSGVLWRIKARMAATLGAATAAPDSSRQ